MITLLCGAPPDTQSSRNVQQPAAGRSTMLGPPCTGRPALDLEGRRIPPVVAGAETESVEELPSLTPRGRPITVTKVSRQLVSLRNPHRPLLPGAPPTGELGVISS